MLEVVLPLSEQLPRIVAESTRNTHLPGMLTLLVRVRFKTAFFRAPGISIYVFWSPALNPACRGKWGQHLAKSRSDEIYHSYGGKLSKLCPEYVSFQNTI